MTLAYDPVRDRFVLNVKGTILAEIYGGTGNRTVTLDPVTGRDVYSRPGLGFPCAMGRALQHRLRPDDRPGRLDRWTNPRGGVGPGVGHLRCLGDAVLRRRRVTATATPWCEGSPPAADSLNGRIVCRGPAGSVAAFTPATREWQWLLEPSGDAASSPSPAVGGDAGANVLATARAHALPPEATCPPGTDPERPWPRGAGTSRAVVGRDGIRPPGRQDRRAERRDGHDRVVVHPDVDLRRVHEHLGQRERGAACGAGIGVPAGVRRRLGSDRRAGGRRGRAVDDPGQAWSYDLAADRWTRGAASPVLSPIVLYERRRASSPRTTTPRASSSSTTAPGCWRTTSSRTSGRPSLGPATVPARRRAPDDGHVRPRARSARDQPRRRDGEACDADPRTGHGTVRVRGPRPRSPLRSVVRRLRQRLRRGDGPLDLDRRRRGRGILELRGATWETLSQAGGTGGRPAPPGARRAAPRPTRSTTGLSARPRTEGSRPSRPRRGHGSGCSSRASEGDALGRRESR